jgi:AraC-like DNA-binding protein
LSSNINIRQLYRPVQPTVKQSGESVVYCEVLPAENLQALIYCYWELKTTQKLEEPFIYRVVADGCIDIYFELHEPVQNFIMGFCKQYTEFPLENQFHYIGIRFLPTVFPALYNINAQELSNRYEKLENVAKDTADFIKTHFSGHENFDKIRTQFDHYFTVLSNKANTSLDPRFQEALHIILKNLGVINVQSDLDIGLSARQLRRYFEFYIGDTAKTFSQVVRFQNILNSKPSTQSLRENKLYFDLGYYDQAHFIKEFKNFYGVTPAKAFGRQ